MQSPGAPGKTAEESALEFVAGQSWGDYVERFRPAEMALARDAELTKGEIAQVKGEVSADTAAAFKGLSRSTVSSNAQAGADLSSGKAKLGLAADATAQARASGLGKGAAATGARIDEDMQNVRIASFGRNLATDVTADLSRGARRATAIAIAESNARFERNAANLDAAATVAGAAYEKYNQVRASASKKRIKAMGKQVSGLSLPNVGLNLPGGSNPMGSFDPFEAERNPLFNAYGLGNLVDPFNSSLGGGFS